MRPSLPVRHLTVRRNDTVVPAPGLGGSAFTRYRDRTYTEVVQVIFDAFLAVAAVGGNGALVRRVW